MSEFEMPKGYLEEKVSTAPATEKLDAVLNYLNDNRKPAYHYGYGLPNNYTKPKGTYLSSQDILNVLDKLERDNMVRMKMMGDGNGNDVEHYCISLDGEVLLQDGGYSQKLIDDRNKKDKVEQDLRISQRNEKTVKNASVAAVIVAAFVFAFQIYEFLFATCHAS
ncbi:hypothetical protein ACKGJY_15290 [Hyunsoonleella sp. 2307UL5-6]|uniref:hypothetical protein n=1 Tax=Hyunsoonleella sp. 2307UL5-6 TaxID=3384768 RepID=UPI0039BC44B5